MSVNITISHTPLTLSVFIQLNDMIVFFINDEDTQRVLYQLLVQLSYDINQLFYSVLCIMSTVSNMSTFVVLGNNNIIIDIHPCNIVSRTIWLKA